MQLLPSLSWPCVPPSLSGWHNSSLESLLQLTPCPQGLTECRVCAWQADRALADMETAALLSPVFLQTSGTRALPHTQTLQPSPHPRLLTTAKIQLHVWLSWLSRAINDTLTPPAPTTAQGRCFSWLLPGKGCSVLAQGTERPGCSGDATQHGARGRMKEWGMLWTSTEPPSKRNHSPGAVL